MPDQTAASSQRVIGDVAPKRLGSGSSTWKIIQCHYAATGSEVRNFLDVTTNASKYTRPWHLLKCLDRTHLKIIVTYRRHTMTSWPSTQDTKVIGYAFTNLPGRGISHLSSSRDEKALTSSPVLTTWCAIKSGTPGRRLWWYTWANGHNT